MRTIDDVETQVTAHVQRHILAAAATPSATTTKQPILITLTRRGHLTALPQGAHTSCSRRYRRGETLVFRFAPPEQRLWVVAALCHPQQHRSGFLGHTQHFCGSVNAPLHLRADPRDVDDLRRLHHPRPQACGSEHARKHTTVHGRRNSQLPGIIPGPSTAK